VNITVVHGIINGDAEVYCNPKDDKDIPLIVFYVKDYGKHNKEPMTWQVKFKKIVGMDILPYLKNGKEVVVNGSVKLKNYVTSFGAPRERVTLEAKFVEFTGLAKNREVAA